MLINNYTKKTSKFKSTKIMQRIVGSTLSMVLILGTPMFAVSQAAQAATAADNLTASKRLNSLLKKTNSMKASFTQTTKGASRSGGGLNAQNGTFSGTVNLKRPNYFRWNITSPSEQLIVTNGSYLWIYDKDLEQVTRQNASNQLGNTPALLLSGNPNKIAQNFKITQPNGSKHYYVLYPKSSDSGFKKLAISFSGGKPKSMVLNDSLGQQTSIRFNNVRVNTSISNSLFNFKPPADVDVINQ